MSVSGEAGRVSSPSFWWMPEMDLRRVIVRFVEEIVATSSTSFEGASSASVSCSWMRSCSRVERRRDSHWVSVRWLLLARYLEMRECFTRLLVSQWKLPDERR